MYCGLYDDTHLHNNKINNYVLTHAICSLCVSCLCGGYMWSVFCDGDETPFVMGRAGAAEVFFKIGF